MLKEAMKSLRVTNKAYESEIAHWLMSGATDLKMGGVILGGEISFAFDENDNVTDNCTVTDELVKRALITYAAVHFGNPQNHDALKAAYAEMKGQLMHATGYTDYGEEPEPGAGAEAEEGEGDAEG